MEDIPAHTITKQRMGFSSNMEHLLSCSVLKGKCNAIHAVEKRTTSHGTDRGVRIMVVLSREEHNFTLYDLPQLMVYIIQCAG